VQAGSKASFGLVALIPLASFQQLAFALGVGVLLDAFLVRAVLTPALIFLVGPASGWPGGRLAGARASAESPAAH